MILSAMPRAGRLLLVAVCAGWLLAGRSSVAEELPRAPEPPVRIAVTAMAIPAFETRDPSRRRFGALEFRGGLELKSAYPNFGGLSGLRMMPDGQHFIALSDRGRWLRGRLVYDAAGAPAGIADAEMAPILGPDGRPSAARNWFDTESLADDGKGTLYVGIERANRILRFDYGRSGLRARGQPIPVPAEIGTLPRNQSLECLAAVPQGMPRAGTLIVISEKGLDTAGNIKGFLLLGPPQGRGAFAVKRSDDFDVTDCVVGPGETLYVLERKFSWLAGVAMRLQRFALKDIVPGAVLAGETLTTADMAYQIDNMEGLGLHRDKAGRVILTLVSDDNFSSIQRTLLLQFAVADD